jgi:hypothetical protein
MYALQITFNTYRKSHHRYKRYTKLSIHPSIKKKVEYERSIQPKNGQLTRHWVSINAHSLPLPHDLEGGISPT